MYCEIAAKLQNLLGVPAEEPGKIFSGMEILLKTASGGFVPQESRTNLTVR